MAEEQRNQPHEEPGDAARRSREGAELRGAEPDARTGAAGGATEAVGTDGRTAATGRAAESGAVVAGGSTEAMAGDVRDRESADRPEAMAAGATAAEEAEAPGMPHTVGEGSPRYADTPDQIPPHGSELSWSAAPHPGYVADPKAGYTTRRLAAGVLIGCLVLALGVFYVTRVLTGRSSNGFGAAPWTAAVERDGAVVGGINAQNSGSAHPVALPAGTTFGDSGRAAGAGGGAGGAGGAAAAVSKATANCQAVTGNTGQLTTTTGTTASIGTWAVQATPEVNSLKDDAAKLGTAVANKDDNAIADAADGLCTALSKVGTLPAMPDAAGSQAWSGGVTALAQAANSALKGAGGDAGALQSAADQLRQGQAQLDALSARIIAAT